MGNRMKEHITLLEKQIADERAKCDEQRRRRIRKKYPTQEQIESEYNEVSSGEEMPLYFQESKQLLDIYTALEESNLFLIQNSQETEQALEEVIAKFDETQRVMGAKANRMKEHYPTRNIEAQRAEGGVHQVQDISGKPHAHGVEAAKGN